MIGKLGQVERFIGAGAIIMPGVTIGDNTEIGEHDRKYYYKDREIEAACYRNQ